MENSNPKIFLLSPAHCGGKRASFLLNPAASFDTAMRFRDGKLTLADVFTFCSGLYFRGKVAYANRFAAAGDRHVITTNRGLLPLETPMNVESLRDLGCATINADDPRYAKPLRNDIAALAAGRPHADFVLLGSVATGKYVDVLSGVLGSRLLFPIDFVGRGDMSRGGLMLRRAESGEELPYAPVTSVQRRGKRPPKLAKPARK